MQNWIQVFKTLSYLACLTTAGIALAAVVGIHYGIVELRYWLGGDSPMRANAALAVLSAALSFFLQTAERSKSKPTFLKACGLGFALLTLGIGLVTLLHYALDLSSGFDELFLKDPLIAPGYSGRPSPDTALCLSLLGLGLLVMNRREPWTQTATEVLSIVALILPMMTLVSAFFGADTLYSMLLRSGQTIGTPLCAALSIILLSFALFFRRPEQGMAAIFASPTMGGLIARRQLLTLILLPFLIVIIVQFELFFDRNQRPLAQALMIVLAFGYLISFNWLTARRLDRIDRQKKVHERHLKEKDRVLSGVLDSVPVGIWIADERGRIVRSNPAAINIWCGQKEADIKEHGLFKAWRVGSGEPLTDHEWALARALERGETTVNETILIECLDGSRKVILNSAMPLRNERGKITGALATNYDITCRYRLEKNQALIAHAGEELLATRDLETTFLQLGSLAIKGLCDSCLIHGFDDDGHLRMMSYACRSTAHAQRFQTLLNRALPQIEAVLNLRAVSEQGLPFLGGRLTHDQLAPTGLDQASCAELKELLHTYMLVPMLVDRKVIGCMSLIGCESSHTFDEIDLAAAQELGRLSALAVENARYAEKLRQAIQTREDMVAIVSHDLRSPLTVILQSCEILAHRLPALAEASAPFLKLVNLAKTAGERMHELISDLLDLARLESGRFDLKREPLECVAFIKDLVELLSPIAAQKGVRLQTSLPQELPKISSDRTRFAQIFTNLVSNALKYTPAGGSVEVSAHYRDDGWVEVAVADTGVGIKKEHLPLVFERYWKPHDSPGGTGLGLFVAKGLVEAHGGRIQVTSEENRGTCFVFTIPTTWTAAEKTAAFPSASTSSHHALEHHNV